MHAALVGSPFVREDCSSILSLDLGETTLCRCRTNAVSIWQAGFGKRSRLFQRRFNCACSAFPHASAGLSAHRSHRPALSAELLLSPYTAATATRTPPVSPPAPLAQCLPSVSRRGCVLHLEVDSTAAHLARLWKERPRIYAAARRA